MEIEIRKMLPEERDFSYSQRGGVMERSGCIGHLRVDMGSNGKGFFSNWDDHSPDLKTQAFKDEFDTVINALRFDKQYGSIFKDRASLAKCCYSEPESSFGNGREYGFRVDTEEHSYMLRLNPNPGEYAAYVYAYDREMLDGVLHPAPELINVLVVEPEQPPYVKAIQPGLESLQSEVGGNIEAVYPYEEPVALIVNEEGKLNGLPLNRALRDEDGHIYDVVAGTLLVVGLGEDDFTSLSEQHIQQFKDKFKTPELFLSLNGKLVVLPMKEKPSVLGKLKTAEAAIRSDKKKPQMNKEKGEPSL